MKVEIISDGDIHATRLIVDGKEVTNLAGLEFKHTAGMKPVLTMWQVVEKDDSPQLCKTIKA